MSATLTRSIGNPHFDEHLKALMKSGINLQEHNDCANCKICRYNQIYVLGHNSELPRSPSSTSSNDNSKMAPAMLSSGDRTLRLVQMWLWIPAFPFLLAHGIISSEMCPVLGIIPMTFAFFVGLVHVTGKAKSRAGNIAIDLFNAIFLMALLIPSWILMAEQHCNRWRCYGNEQGIIAAYGTVPMIVQFCIHSFFVLREVDWRKMNPFTSTEPETCPHCSGDLSVRQRGKQPKTHSQHSHSSKESYLPVSVHDATAEYDAQAEEEDRGRPSTDDENARLV